MGLVIMPSLDSYEMIYLSFQVLIAHTFRCCVNIKNNRLSIMGIKVCSAINRV